MAVCVFGDLSRDHHCMLQTHRPARDLRIVRMTLSGGEELMSKRKGDVQNAGNRRISPGRGANRHDSSARAIAGRRVTPPARPYASAAAFERS